MALKKQPHSNPWLKSNLDKSYEVTTLKYKSFDISYVTISKMWTRVLLVYYSVVRPFKKKRTSLYQWFKSNFNKIYEVTSSKYQPFDRSHVTI